MNGYVLMRFDGNWIDTTWIHHHDHGTVFSTTKMSTKSDKTVLLGAWAGSKCTKQRHPTAGESGSRKQAYLLLFCWKVLKFDKNQDRIAFVCNKNFVIITCCLLDQEKTSMICINNFLKSSKLEDSETINIQCLTPLLFTKNRTSISLLPYKVYAADSCPSIVNVSAESSTMSPAQIWILQKWKF